MRLHTFFRSLSLKGQKQRAKETLEARMENDWDSRAQENAMYYIDTQKMQWTTSEFFLAGKKSSYQLTNDFFNTKGFNPSGMCMLDIGCGIGRMTVGFSEMFAEVWGTDISGEMILKAKELNQSENVKFVKGNGRNLDNFINEYFDFVFSYKVFQHVPDKQVIFNYFSEIYRVLKPGGLFKIHLKSNKIDFILSFIPYILLYARDICTRVLKKKVGKLAKGESWWGTSIKKNKVKQQLEKIGFEEVEILKDNTTPGGKKRYWCCGKKPN